MEVSALIDYYKHLLPFTEQEYIPDRIEAVVNEAFSYYSYYRPLVKTEVVLATGLSYSFPESTAPEYILRVYYYTLGMLDTDVSNTIRDWKYYRPVLYIMPGQYYIISGYNWSFTNITIGELKKEYYLKELLKNEIKKSLANRRRVGNLEGVTMNLKGDEFYNEAKEELRELRDKIERVLPPVHH